MKELFQKISEEKRNRIMDAARKEFAARGYDNSTTSNIAKQAGISNGSLFQYFDSKEDLFMTIVKQCSDIIKAIFEEIIQQDTPFFQTIEAFLRKIFQESKSSPEMIKLYFEMSSPSKNYMTHKVAQELERESCNWYIKLLLKAKEEGHIRADCDIPMFAFLLDNIFMMLQYSIACEYYQDRIKIYGGDKILTEEDRVIQECMAFIKGACGTHS